MFSAAILVLCGCTYAFGALGRLAMDWWRILRPASVRREEHEEDESIAPYLALAPKQESELVSDLTAILDAIPRLGGWYPADVRTDPLAEGVLVLRLAVVGVVVLWLAPLLQLAAII